MSKILALLKAIGPPVMIAAGVPPQMIPVVLHGMDLAEYIHDAKGLGPNKLTMVRDMAGTVVAGINGAKPGTLDGLLVDAAIVQGVTATVSIINAVGKDLPMPTLPATNPT